MNRAVFRPWIHFGPFVKHRLNAQRLYEKNSHRVWSFALEWPFYTYIKLDVVAMKTVPRLVVWNSQEMRGKAKVFGCSSCLFSHDILMDLVFVSFLYSSKKVNTSWQREVRIPVHLQFGTDFSLPHFCDSTIRVRSGDGTGKFCSACVFTIKKICRRHASLLRVVERHSLHEFRLGSVVKNT